MRFAALEARSPLKQPYPLAALIAAPTKQAGWLRLRRVWNWRPPNLTISLAVERVGLRPPVQLFQTFSHLKPAFFKSFAICTVWTMDFQEEKQVAFCGHNHLTGRVIRLAGVLHPRWVLLLGGGETYYPTRCGGRFNKIGAASALRGVPKEHRCEARKFPREISGCGRLESQACRILAAGFVAPTPPYFFPAFTRAHLVRCAAAIFLRADADMVRLAGVGAVVFAAPAVACDPFRVAAHRFFCARLMRLRASSDRVRGPFELERPRAASAALYL